MADYNADLLTVAQKQISSLEAEIQVLKTVSAKYKEKLDKTKYILKSLVEFGQLDDEEAIAELNQILDLELNKEVTYEIHATIQVTVELPYGEEPQEYDFDITEVQYNGDTLEIVSSDISHLELLD